MKTPISILSWGVVSPGGTGVDSLERPEAWPYTLVSEIADPARNHPVSSVDLEKDPINRWRLRPRLRRASPISHYMMEAAAQALESHPEIDRTRLGIVSASFLGCLLYSVRFYRQFQKEGRRFASPALFPETVANSPLSHLVSELKIGGPVYSQIGDKSCWSNALRTAACWLFNEDAEHVLVIGAEEFEAHALDAFRSARWLNKPFSVPFSHGAGAVLLGLDPSRSHPRICTLEDGFSFRTVTECRAAAQQCLTHFDNQTPVYDSATGWIGKIAAEAIGTRTTLTDLPNLKQEALTASCAWDTIRTANYLRSHPDRAITLPFWGLSQGIGAALISGATFR